MKVLFAYPDHKFVQLYQQHLKDHFFVDSAHDGLTALRKFKANRPGIVVSSYHLPVFSGVALLKFIRNSPNISATPFVFLSEKVDNSDALSYGANDWIEISDSSPDLLIKKIYYHLNLNKHALQIR